MSNKSLSTNLIIPFYRLSIYTLKIGQKLLIKDYNGHDWSTAAKVLSTITTYVTITWIPAIFLPLKRLNLRNAITSKVVDPRAFFRYNKN